MYDGIRIQKTKRLSLKNLKVSLENADEDAGRSYNGIIINVKLNS